jgi:O-antigen biosynthesis protein WbqV
VKIRWPQVTTRKALIVAHDLAVTALALLASFYIRFEEVGLTERRHGLMYILPPFVAYAGLVYCLFHLYEGKWRFASLPDLFNIFRAVTVLAVSLLILDYVLLSPYFYGTFFFGKLTIVLYWCLQMLFLGGPRVTYRYYRYTRSRHQAISEEATPTLILGRAADVELLLRAIESGAIKRRRLRLSHRHDDRLRARADRRLRAVGRYDGP